MAVQPNEVKKVSLSGEFDDLSNSQIQTYLSLAIKQTPESIWGDCTDDAIKFLAAHYLVLAQRGGSSGSVSSEKVGDLSVNYSQMKSDSEYATTSYGQMYLQLRKGLAITPRLTCPR